MSRYDEERFDQGALPPAMLPNGQVPDYQQPAPVQHYNSPAPRRQRTRDRLRIACLGCALALVASFAIFACLLAIIGLILYNKYDQQLAEQLKTKLDEQSQTFQTAMILDRRGNELHELFGEGRRTKIKLADLPKEQRAYLIDATISVEDITFYDNPGVDWVAISRAGLQYFQATSGNSGGSTITQQLVRNIAFDYQYRTERSFQRKFEEIVMALILTREKPKDEILEMYLNQIYYGNLAYGIEAASLTYFGKPASQLSLSEVTLLAGLPQAPAELDPLNPDPKVQQEVLDRRKLVLDMMVSRGKVSSEEAAKAKAQTLVYANPNVNLKSPHFTVYAEQELKSLLEALNKPPEYLTTKGLKVYTTLDSEVQTLVENTARQQIASIKAEHNANNAAVVVLKPATGEIVAMLGSVNYNDVSIQGRVNVAISLKQPGSAIKPVTYSAAMERGFTAATILWDVESHIKSPGSVYSPVDYDGRYRGPVRLRQALANSYNIPAVQTLRQIGVPTLMSMAQRMRISSLGTDPSRFGLALTLGGGEVTPLELTQAYAVLANGGNLVASTSILCLIDGDNKVIYQYEGGCDGKGIQDADTINNAANPKPILDRRIAFVLSDILGDNVARSAAMGSNSALRTDGIITSVKTGTTNDFRDNWTVGYTHNVVVGVWVGNTDSTPMVHTTGLTGATPIWHDVMTTIYNNPSLLKSFARAGNLLPDNLTPPDGMVRRRICELNLMKDPITACQPGRTEWFLATPAAVPDASGKLVYPPNFPPPTRAPANGPLIINVDEGIAQAIVQPIDPSLAASLVSNVAGQPAVPPPLYCLVPNEVKDQVPTAQAQIFVKPPPFPDQAVYARIWARNNGIAMLPGDPCTPEMLISQPQVEGITTRINSPLPGQTVTKMVQVTGSAVWPPDRGKFFKMEIQGPQFPNWVTFGHTHDTPVINGLLDEFGAEGLQPGTYRIRITIVGVDGGYLANSAEIPIQVTGQ